MNKKTEKETLRKISEDFFEFVASLGELAVNMALPTYSQLRIDGFSKRKYYYSLQKFEDMRLIKKVRRNKRMTYVLTEHAIHLRKKASIKLARTDGLSTIVMFDIPEVKHNVRDNLRRYLIRNGYTQIQKSVFISPFKIFGELKEFIKDMGIESNVTFISGKIDR